MTQMELSEKEAGIIREHRAEQARKEAIAKRMGEYLEVANDFYQWMQKEGAGPTFSTFCDDYGYEPTEFSRKAVYEAAINLIDSARAMASQ